MPMGVGLGAALLPVFQGAQVACEHLAGQVQALAYRQHVLRMQCDHRQRPSALNQFEAGHSAEVFGVGGGQWESQL